MNNITASAPCKIVILISGRGSNMMAIVGQLKNQPNLVNIVAVISNNPQAEGLVYATNAGISTYVINHREFQNRQAFDDKLAKNIEELQADLVVLAGFMRILGKEFISKFTGRILNIHPSLLPAFPGLDTHQRALDCSVKVHGCTVHFVTAELDHGPIVAQATLAVLPNDNANSLANRVLLAEHQIYPQAIRWFAQGILTIKQNQVHITNTSYTDNTTYYPSIKLTHL